MPYQFKTHYTVEQARALLPRVRKWLELIDHHRERIDQLEKRLAAFDSHADVGGESVNQLIRSMVQLKDVLLEFESREILIKDIDRGLVDFPALRDGREIFLCWEKDETNIEHWHDLDSGFSGREPL